MKIRLPPDRCNTEHDREVIATEVSILFVGIGVAEVPFKIDSADSYVWSLDYGGNWQMSFDKNDVGLISISYQKDEIEEGRNEKLLPKIVEWASRHLHGELLQD